MCEHCHLATGHQNFPPVPVFSILAWIHLQWWVSRSGPSGLSQGWLVDAWTMGLAPLVGVELHLEPSPLSGHGASIGPVLAGVGAVYCLMASPPDRKESQTNRQGGFTAYLFIEVELVVLLGAFFDWGGSPTLPCPTPGPQCYAL